MKKFAVGIVSALVGGTMLVSGGAAASAQTKAPTVEIQNISPNPVIVRGNNETEAFFKVAASSDVEKVTLTVEPQGFHTLRAKDVKALESWRFAVPFNKYDPEGKWKATATGEDKDGKIVVSDSAYFYVDVRKGKADTRITRFSADPYKVRKGKSIYFSGRLQVDDHGWEGLRGQPVKVLYRANGSSGWKWVASTKSTWGGKFTAKSRAYKSGTFKAVYSGDRKLQSAESRTDYVRVYGSRWHHHR
ncbi:hypothetical protein [Nonomuraea cavernae]|uniref:Uncharacterized protein n=1 Tax=Nonomuraea cavernae TaxID=2045107 RepID=A0A917YZT2_9ACTN|nr:hypothetical protein [Nonomuraea cavernae]MCA2185999.1 hypothetical protein [Nonomuraea cavernae]GGO68992.1 hypothetical protein GCM10012289_29010 [Nonomuraea cavernae]